MNENSNSVNIDRSHRSYHHGNLRAALVSEGLNALREEDADDISLRAVARRIGVSATSVYRHFPDKQAFIEALCAEGSRMLAAAQREAMLSSGGGQTGLDATGLAYVNFALANPTLFRLMSRAAPSETGLGGAKDPAMQELMSNVATLLPKNVSEERRRIRALHAWSVVHGITMLVLEGRLPRDNEMIKGVIQTPVD
ncbi:TetR/AcrR family transcriptional regulator [Roseibium album]|uniref:TetR/AcrR family transcriptional regulator n=1 Tax=Roseibium album TaxID=311410 RepID=UPI002491D6EA|nr:TetR/AcrR family transcriptional regulator [Roseibium album]